MLDVDILQLQDIPLTGDNGELAAQRIPWVKSFHAPFGNHEVSQINKRNWIFVSKSHAESFGCERYVYNGLDPKEFIYSETKEDYFIFIILGLERAIFKGLGIALYLVQELGIKLVVAGSSQNKFYEKQFAAMCQEQGIEWVGEINGQRKAELIAGAKALLFPTMINEPFGLVAAEALISGTPVICSNRGACPELISPDVGFVCERYQDYITAIENLEKISPAVCREKAMSNFHYLKMAEGFVQEYLKEINFYQS